MNKRVILGIALLVALATFAAPALAYPLRVINDNDTVVLQGNVNPHARPEFDVGPTDYSLPMERMILSLRLSPDKQSELEQLLAEQQDPASPNFHRWLTPEEFGKRFGPDREDLDTITHWLTSHGFTVEEVAKGRTWINFSGKVSDVEHAFHTRIHDYQVDGRLYHANANDPSIPRGLADLVSGIVSLHNFPRKTMHSGIRPLTASSQPEDTSGSYHYLSPGDFATIYNVTALYSAGIDGTGQIIAIVGRTNPSNNVSNWATFRSDMGLPVNAPTVIVNGADPGDQGYDEDNEADLDVEWSGAVAKNATIKFVTSKSTSSTDGVDLSAQYIVNNNLAAVMSTSFGSCESAMGTTENSFYNTLWSQAASYGITSFVSSGDAGAAGCNSGSDSSGSGRAVSGLSSTPYNVAVGGTEFNEGSGSYWNSSNGTGYTSALSYIPEVAWNESGSAGSCPFGDSCSGLWATGGGASTIYQKPSWQVSPGVPADGRRDVPDVSLSAAGHDGYLVYTTALNSKNKPVTTLWVFGGTSCSSPSFAGLMALIVQKTGTPQGNANVRLYQLGNAQYASGGAAVFHDITSGDNSVPGVTGFACTIGYDQATGLGSVNANALVNNWTGTGTTKIGVFVNGTWYLDLNGNGQWDGPPIDGLYNFGGGVVGAIPVTGDWNGSGTTKIGVFVPGDGLWYLDYNGNGTWDGTSTDKLYTFGNGIAGAIPVTGDWNGSGTTKIGVFDPATGLWYLDYNGNGVWDGTVTDKLYSFGGGLAGAIPVTGDWTGDGTTKIGVFVNGTWYLDLNGNGVWDGTPTDGLYYFGGGLAGAVPVTGDWTGNGTTKIGVFVNGTWYLDLNGNGVWDGTPTDGLYYFGGGVVGAIPVTGKW